MLPNPQGRLSKCDTWHRLADSCERRRLGSRTLCFIAILYYAIPLFLILFTNYAQLSSLLCPMCTQRLRDSSERVGALSRSSNDTVDSEDVDSASLGILPELRYELLQESDVAILVLQLLHTWAFSISYQVTRLNNYVSAFRLPIMLEIVLMLIAAYCALNYAGIMCACLQTTYATP